MPHPEFQDKHQPVRPERLSAVLGAASPAWESLIAALAQGYAPLQQEWKFYTQQSGWTLALKQKKRTLAHLRPDEQRFHITLIYGERAVEAARQSSLPPEIWNRIEQAKPYVEGRGFKVEVSSLADLPLVMHLIQIKMEH